MVEEIFSEESNRIRKLARILSHPSQNFHFTKYCCTNIINLVNHIKNNLININDKILPKK